MVSQRFVLMTGHRRENFGEGFLQICHALKDLAAHYPNVQFIYPVHLNPNVQQPVNAILADLPNVHLLAPLDYEPFVYLTKVVIWLLSPLGMTFCDMSKCPAHCTMHPMMQF